MTSPPVHRRGEQSRQPRAQLRTRGYGRPRSRRARRRTAWERATSASGSDMLASFVLILAAAAWLITFYFVLTFVW